jgi:hypothetical protein
MAEDNEKVEHLDVEFAEQVQQSMAEHVPPSSNIRAVLICLFSMCGAMIFGMDNG